MEHIKLQKNLEKVLKAQTLSLLKHVSFFLIEKSSIQSERDLRPSVIARKVSFGSVTDAGAHVQSTLTTVVTTLKKRGQDLPDRIMIGAALRDDEDDPAVLSLLDVAQKHFASGKEGSRSKR